MLMYNYANHTDYWPWRGNVGSSEQPGVEITNPVEKGNFMNRLKYYCSVHWLWSMLTEQILTVIISLKNGANFAKNLT